MVKTLLIFVVDGRSISPEAIVSIVGVTVLVTPLRYSTEGRERTRNARTTMQIRSLDERITAVELECRLCGIPTPLTIAIIRYLKGYGSIAEVQELWQGFSRYCTFHINGLGYILTNHEPSFGLFEQRMLDILSVLDTISTGIRLLAWQAWFPQVPAYLVQQGLPEHELLDTCMHLISNSTAIQPRPVKAFLLSYLPDRWDELFHYAIQRRSGSPEAWIDLIKLLLRSDPPYIDQAWQLAQHMGAINGCGLGQVVALLLRTDYERFASWAREIAGPNSPGNGHDRRAALEALLARDWRSHLDLALAAARTPVASSSWEDAGLQRAGLAALKYYLRPSDYADIAAELALSPHPKIAKQALDMLQTQPFMLARPFFQRCVTEGHIQAALIALIPLITEEWEGRQVYVLSLLAHRSKQIRQQIMGQILKREDAVALVAPFLSHRKAEARLAAVEVLRRAGGDEANDLLASRFNLERSQRVRRVIGETIGLLA